MKHAKEPWEVVEIEREDGDRSEFNIYSGENEVVGCEGLWDTWETDAANASRIVSCVNACAGIKNPEDLRKQRDELMAFVIKKYEEEKARIYRNSHPSCTRNFLDSLAEEYSIILRFCGDV